MRRGEACALAIAALVLCAVCAWAVHALLAPDSVLALGALAGLC